MQTAEHFQNPPVLRPIDERAFAASWQHRPILDFVEVADPSALIILTDGASSAGAFKACAPGVWQQMLSLPAGAPMSEWVTVAAAMRDWMFDNAGAASIWSIADSRNAAAAALSEAIGARLVLDEGGRCVFEICRGGLH